MANAVFQLKAAEIRNLALTMRRTADELIGVADLFDAVAARLPADLQAADPPRPAGNRDRKT